MDLYVSALLFGIQTIDEFLNDLDELLQPFETHSLYHRRLERLESSQDNMANESRPPSATPEGRPLASAESNRTIRLSTQKRPQTAGGPLPGPEFNMPKIDYDGSVAHLGDRLEEEDVAHGVEINTPLGESSRTSGPSRPAVDLSETGIGSSSKDPPPNLLQPMQDSIEEAVSNAVTETMAALKEDIQNITQEFVKDMSEKLKASGAERARELKKRLEDLRSEMELEVKKTIFGKDYADTSQDQASDKSLAAMPPGSSTVSPTGGAAGRKSFREKIVSSPRRMSGDDCI